jgi:hypothetical protein
MAQYIPFPTYGTILTDPDIWYDTYRSRHMVRYLPIPTYGTILTDPDIWCDTCRSRHMVRYLPIPTYGTIPYLPIPNKCRFFSIVRRRNESKNIIWNRHQKFIVLHIYAKLKWMISSWALSWIVSQEQNCHFYRSTYLNMVDSHRWS